MDAANGGELTGGLGCLNGPFPAALQRLIMESKWKWGRRLSRREGEKEKGSATVKPYGLRAKPTNHSKCAQVYNISTVQNGEEKEKGRHHHQQRGREKGKMKRNIEWTNNPKPYHPPLASPPLRRQPSDLQPFV
ncbi:uncharacterized protein BKA78DRAFT_157705 [Phyllosticta capitalensis]|uniref:uncharacterized protein n=1 Tax=Phyllosticta capitalensis TaxID=121624 RepID=UPI0031326935